MDIGMLLATFALWFIGGVAWLAWVRKDVLERESERDPMPAAPDKSPPRRTKHCRKCGCDQRRACIDRNAMPCHWVTPTLCSHCADLVPAWKPGMAIYQARWYGDGLSVVVRRHVLDRSGPAPLIVNELATAVVRRPELLRTPNTSIIDEVATSILADCLQDDTQAAELGPLYATVLADQFGENWILNEFELREWVAENTIPY